MIKVTKFVARSFDLDHLDLYWEIKDFDNGTDVITAYEFYILRSESPEGPFDTLAGPFEDQYSYRDAGVNLLHKWRRLFYKLKVVHKPTGDVTLFGAAANLADPDLIALEIQRQEDVLLRQFIGRRCWLFPVRTFGAKCFCFDLTTGRRTRSNCPTCFDSGYLNGYLTPIETYIQFDPNPESPSNTSIMGEQDPKNTSARLIAFPPVKPKDIIVEAENKRWRVVTVNKTERLRSVVHQELTLHRIPVGDIEYKLPINLSDLENQQFAEERNFTNPQHTDDHGEEPDDLLAVYGHRPRGAIG